MEYLARNQYGQLSLADIRQWAQLFVDSGMFKDTRDVAKACVKLQAGQELGLPPFASMRGFDIVEGRAAPNAGLAAALINRSGRYSYTVLEATPERCVIDWFLSGQRLGQTSFTIAEAQRAGLTGKAVWKSYPDDLCFARALMRGARRFCADLFLGSIYTPEELGADDQGAASIDAEPSAADTDAVSSWRARVEAAAGGRELLGIFRAASGDANPYRAGAAMALAARRFVDVIPQALTPEAADSVYSVLGEMLAGLQGAANPRHFAPERAAVIGAILDAMANLKMMGAGAEDVALPALEAAEEMEADELPAVAEALAALVDINTDAVGGDL